MKENLIREYINSIDFKSDWKLSSIKSDMRKFLGEEPAIDIQYKKDVLIQEDSGKAIEIEKIQKIEIVFTDIDNKFKKLEFRYEI